ncbi:MAG: M48 family metalloprotease [Syntrophorhabdaceae bacterium]|nr:M48 family metalloprotease [Syntrophorhabdaceae bacterium]
MVTLKKNHHHKIKVLFLLLVFFMLSVLIGCATNPVTGKSQLMFLSEEQEIQMGKDIYPNAIWEGEGGGGEYRDDRLKAYLKNIVLDIHRVSHRPNLPLDFAIQNSSVPNAWAIPGHVVITRGLLSALDNEGEFAFVMGHEMGHVAARHSASQVSWSIFHQAILTGAGIALSGSDYSDLALMAGSLGSSLLLLKYSRNDELEADRLGLEYMSKLGYDPNNAVSAHRNLEKVSNEYLKSLNKGTQERGFFEELLSTHPRTSRRIEEIQSLIKQTPLYSKRGDGSNREQFQSMIGGIKKSNENYIANYDKAVQEYKNNRIDEALKLVNKAISNDPSQAPFYTLLGYILIKKKDYGGAEKQFDRALQIDNNYQPAIRGKGILHNMRDNYGESIGYLKRSLALFPGDTTSKYYLGMSYYKTGDFRSAVTQLKPVAEAWQKHPTIYGLLGICYEKLNDINSAYRAYNLQIKVAPNNEMGKWASQRIGVLKTRIR